VNVTITFSGVLLYIESPTDLSEVDVYQGSNDTMKSWINGKEFHKWPDHRLITVDSDKKKIDLNKGWNNFMAKVCNSGGKWRYSLNFPTGEEIGLEFTTDKKRVEAVHANNKLSTIWGAIKEAH